MMIQGIFYRGHFITNSTALVFILETEMKPNTLIKYLLRSIVTFTGTSEYRENRDGGGYALLVHLSQSIKKLRESERYNKISIDVSVHIFSTNVLRKVS